MAKAEQEGSPQAPGCPAPQERGLHEPQATAKAYGTHHLCSVALPPFSPGSSNKGLKARGLLWNERSLLSRQPRASWGAVAFLAEHVACCRRSEVRAPGLARVGAGAAEGEEPEAPEPRGPCLPCQTPPRACRCREPHRRRSVPLSRGPGGGVARRRLRERLWLPYRRGEVAPAAAARAL